MQRAEDRMARGRLCACAQPAFVRRSGAPSTRGQPHETCTNRREPARSQLACPCGFGEGSIRKGVAICVGFVRRTRWSTNHKPPSRWAYLPIDPWLLLFCRSEAPSACVCASIAHPLAFPQVGALGQMVRRKPGGASGAVRPRARSRPPCGSAPPARAPLYRSRAAGRPKAPSAWVTARTMALCMASQASTAMRSGVVATSPDAKVKMASPSLELWTGLMARA